MELGPDTLFADVGRPHAGAMDAPVAAGYGVDPGPWVVAHRGGAGLAFENTLEAFQRSVALGVRYLEVDARATSDGVCVALHDADLHRVAGVRAQVANLEWNALSRTPLRTGAPVLRVDTLFEAFPEARFMVDLKDRRAIPALSKAVRSPGLRARVCLAGADDDVLSDAVAVLGPGVQAAMGWRSAGRLAVAARFGTRPRGVVRAPFVHVPLRLRRVPVFAGRLVAMAAELGARVLVWTVDDARDMHRLLDAGVAGIITDRPDVGREVLLARGVWRPASDRSSDPGPASPAHAAEPAPAPPTAAPTIA